MKSEIEDNFTEKEKEVLKLYRSPESKTIKTNIRLSIQYAIVALAFSVLTIIKNPNFVWAVFGTFVAWMIVRIISAKKIIGSMPNIIEKYEEEIKRLKQ